jgi:ribonuclease Z
VVAKLAARGLAPEAIDAVVLTHDHVDHVYGLPHLLHALAIGGSTRPLPVFAPAPTLRTVQAVVAAYGLDGADYPALAATIVDPDGSAGFEVGGLPVRAAWSEHSRPTLATRWEHSGRSFASTSDTVGTSRLDGLARGVELLLHDCGGLHRDREEFGSHHASAREAAETAERAGAGTLALVHLPALDDDGAAALRAEAAASFGGEVVVTADGDRFSLAD